MEEGASCDSGVSSPGEGVVGDGSGVFWQIEGHLASSYVNVIG